MNATTPTQATFAPPPAIGDPATQGAKRDTFGGNDDVNGLAQATNNMAIADTSPGKATWDWDDSRPSPNGAVNPAANGGPIANGGSAVPRRMPTGGAVPLESPALFMPGGPQVNPSVPGERPGLPQRPSRSYRGQKPEIVTHYEKPLDERPSSVLQPKSSVAVGAVVPPDIRPKSASRSNSRKSIPKAVPPPTSPPPVPPVAAQTQTPTAAAFPVPPGNAPPVPAQQQAAAATGAPTATGVPEPYDYEQARSNFYSVPDPTRPETAQAYREEREPVPEASPETKPMDGPTSHPTLIAPVPIPMNNNVRRTSMPRAEPTGYSQNAAPVDTMATPQARPQSRTSYPQNASPVNAMAGPQARPQTQNLMASPQARPHSHNLSRNSSHYSARNQPLNPSASIQGQRLPPIQDGAVHVGDVMTFDQQQRLQGGSGMHTPRGHQLVDDGPVDKPLGRSVSLDRRRSFGYRPQPILMEDEFGAGGRDSRAESWFGPDHRTNMVGRSNTTRSRATAGRNGTLSRASNGGTIGRRAGAFGMGAGLSVGTQPEEILGREDIHARAEVSDRQLDRDTLRRLSQMEKKDARKLEKLMKEEERAQARSLEQSIRDLKHLAKMQKEAIANERKSQSHLAKWTGREHRARMRFLKEKERYEKVENILRGAENDFEERRDHAAGLTAQIAERTQEIDDLRAQKAADDRERRVKKHAMRNPAYA